MDPRAPTLGAYVTLGELGRGGMGIVYKAHAPDGQTVAIKLLRNKDPAALARFERERRLLAQAGAGFVPLLDAGASAQGPYFVMPLVEGGTLRDRLQTGPLPVDEVVRIGRALATTLARAHEQGIVHRDLKPENVLFTKEGEPLVADLGLAKHWSGAEGATSARLSLTGDFLGTAGYMAPEQMESARDATPAADVFALGAILHECLAGRPTFFGATLIEVLTAVSAGAHLDVRVARPETPRWLAAIVERALARHPGDRFQDAGELARTLAAERAPRRRLAWLAPLLLAAGLAAALATRRPETEAPPPVAAVTTSVAPRATPGRVPALCAGFARTSLATLVEVVNDYQGSHSSPVEAVAISHDGTRLATGAGSVVAVWSLAARELEEVRSFRLASGSVLSLAWSDDDARLLAGTSEGVLHELDPATGEDLALRSKFEGAIGSISLAPNGLVVTGVERRALVVSMASRDLVPSRVYRAPIKKVCVTHGGAQFVVVLADGYLDYVSLGATAQRELEIGTNIDAIAFTRDGRFAAAAGADHRVYLLDLEGDGFTTGFGKLDGRASAIEYSPAADLIYCAVGTHIKVLNNDLHQQRTTFDVPDEPTALAATTSGTLVVASRDGMVRVLDAANGVDRHPRSGHGGAVLAVDATPDGTLVSASADQTIRVLDAERHEEILRAKAGAVRGVAVSRDGRILVSVHADGKLRNWDLAARSARVVKTRGARGVLLTPAGRAVTWGTDDPPRVWRLDTLRPDLTFEHAGAVTAAAISPSGTRVVLASGDGSFEVRSLSTGQELGRSKIEAAVASCAFLGEEELLLGDAVGGLRSWSLARATETTRFVGHAQAVRALAVTPDAGRVLSASDDGTIRIWDRAGRQLDVIDLASSTDRATSIVCRDAHAFAVGTARGVVLRFALTD
ncbi:MAG TPA: protein kinase [Planctomycetota bacterium]|nr:protein kinase [Planctomycetota bacterium]